jgi:hypothetical protein
MSLSVERARRELVRSLGDFDFNRAPSPSAAAAPFKQWVHTTVWHPEVTLVVNFSSVHRDREPEHRLTSIVYTPSDVAGHVRRFAPGECRVPTGRATIVFGANRTSRLGDEYDVEIFEPELELRASLTLRAATHASTTQGVKLGGGQLGWSVIPRLVARGTIQHAGQVHRIDDAPAYRDRNWGCFSFGELSWDWLYALPERSDAPWAVVVSRVTDRTRSAVWQQALLLWEGRDLLATFRDRDVSLCGANARTDAVTTVPAALSLCRPGHATDVPRSLEVEARSSRGELRLRFEAEAAARIVVPNEARLGVTPIHESLGRCTVSGIVEGEHVEFTGHGFLECLHG